MSSIRPSMDRLILITPACLDDEIFQQSKTKNIVSVHNFYDYTNFNDLLRSENQFKKILDISRFL